MKNLLDRLLDVLGIARISDVDEHAAHLGVMVAGLRSDVDELGARVDEFVGVKPVREDVR